MKYLISILLGIMIMSNVAHGQTVLFPRGGGTGTSSKPTYGQLLVGNANGLYDLVATSSLNLGSGVVGSGTQGQTPFYNAAGTTLTASSSLSISQAGGVSIPYTLGVTGLTTLGNASTTQISTDYLFGNTTPFIIQAPSQIRLQIDGGTQIFDFTQALFAPVLDSATDMGTIANRWKSIFTTYASTTALTSTGSAYLATTGGSVTIGTVTPVLGFNLTVVGATTARASFTAATTNDAHTLYANGSDASNVIVGKNNAAGDALISTGGLAYGGVFGTSGARPVQLMTNYLPRLTIDSAGLVGIGTTTPWGLLSVNPNGISGPSFAIGSSTKTDFVVTNGGNVGIGTASPSTILHIDSSNPTLTMKGTSNNDTMSINFVAANGTTFGTVSHNLNAGEFKIGNVSANSHFVTIYSNNAERMRIAGDGNVGIGTTSPATTLSVAGNGYFTGGLGVGKVNTTANTVDIVSGGSYRYNGAIIAYGVTADENYFFGASGNLTLSGLRNTSVGSLALTAITSGNNNTAIGRATLNANTTGGSNTAIGAGALVTNTTGSNNTGVGLNALTANTIGTDNTAVGPRTLDANTTGSNNVGIGSDALGANTVGEGMVAVGNGAMIANTDGVFNAALGDGAMGGNTTGSRNSGFGRRALQYSVTGNNNTALGNQALANNLSATSSTAVGSFAGQGTANTSNQGGVYVGYNSGFTAGNGADYNTYIGYESGYSTLTGTANTALGYETLRANVSGNNNVALGSNALTANTGDNNVAIGASSGALSANTTGGNNVGVGTNAGITNTTGSTNTFLGAFADVASNNLSNATAIGHFAIVGASNSLVLGGTGANAVKVGIGTTTPYAKLSVVGPVVAEYFHATSTTATSTFSGGLSIGSMAFDTNAGAIAWIDMPVTSAVGAGTVESYTARIDGSSILTIYAESDGSGGTQNRRVGVNDTTPDFGLDVTGTVAFTSLTGATAGTNNDVCIDSSTKELKEETTGTCVVSSKRFKHDISPLNLDSKKIINSLTPSKFIVNTREAEGIQYGFIAEDAEKADAHLINTKDGLAYNLDDHAFLAVLWDAVKKLFAKDDAQDREIEMLKAEIAELKLQLK